MTNATKPRERCNHCVYVPGMGPRPLFRQCAKYAVVDGYCAQHHPDAKEKRRQEAARKFAARRSRDPVFNALQTGARYWEISGELAAALRAYVEADEKPQPPGAAERIKTTARDVLQKYAALSDSK